MTERHVRSDTDAANGGSFAARSSAPDADAVRRVIDAVWRIESAQLIARLTRDVRDLALAEDLAQDALVQALEKWPTQGVPDKPGAWLMAVARRRAIDHRRRRPMLDRTHAQLGAERDAESDARADALYSALDDDVGDERLGLMLMTCHPVLAREARVALTLRLLGGLTTEEIARAFLVAESTIAQRIVRAKRSLSVAKVPFEVPRGAELRARVGTILDVLYLIFNEGYSATGGDSWTRPTLCEEALRLGRIVAGLVADDSDVHGVVALMELQASRLRARVGSNGEPVLLLDQDRGRWDYLLIGRGLQALARAETLAQGRQQSLGPYTLQAAIAACHARARIAADTDWVRIAALYDALAEAVPSPIVELNRAVAVAMAYGPASGLLIVDALAADAANGGVLQDYHLLPSVRGDLLEKLGRMSEARDEFARAALMTRNAREQQLLLSRAAAITASAIT